MGVYLAFSGWLSPIFFWVHIAIIVGGIFMGLFLPLWLVALMVVGHRYHLYLFDGCIFSRFQTKLGTLAADKNFLQDAARVLFSKNISAQQAAKVDHVFVNSSIAIAAVATLLRANSLMDVAVVLVILAGLSLSWRMILEARTNQFVCQIGSKCGAVRASDYAKLFGVKAEVLGTLYFAGMLGCYGLIASGIWPAAINLFYGLAALGLVISLYFIYVQAIQIKEYCLSCLKAHAASISLFAMTTLSVVS